MIRVAILTVSDSAAAGKREDLSGPALENRCRELNWPVIQRDVVPDEKKAVSERLKSWADDSMATLILTTGGTGVAPRDVTPEATRDVLDREIPGLAELMRMKGLEQTKFAAVSRGMAGNRGNALIVNLPGSPKGAVFSLSTIEGLIPHVIDLLAGKTEHCVK
ncbi:MAG TPA: MogA/MoaB family molybdenum cofactor biosynthesis protein [Bryobacteraceae bacterium]|nr:MogA/MoaB family molybdenum cofactor biosynthesis protein [Bryobacteraceae bacterium]